MSNNHETNVPEFDKNFSFLSGDCCWEDYGGCWYRRISEFRFQVVSIFNWEDAVGAREAAEQDGTHHVALYELDTSLEEQRKSSLASCGWEIEDDGSIGSSSGDIIAEAGDELTWHLVVCDAMNGYGARAEVGSWNGDDVSDLFKKAAAASNSLADSEEAYEARMDETGNKLGSTLREMREGDFNSAVMRGLAKGDDNAKLMVKIMHGPDSVGPLTELAKLQEWLEAEL